MRRPFVLLGPLMPHEPRQVGLPPRLFLYTLDQIATLISVDLKSLQASYVHYDRRSVGAKPKSKMLARNIAPPMQSPEWRVSEQDLIKWLKVKGFRPFLRGWV